MTLLVPLLSLCIAASLGAPSPSAPGAAGEGGARRPNVVLVVLDDIGVDKIGAYHETPPDQPSPWTPTLDALAAHGLLFERAYTDPLCSPSRAQILTGRHAFRTGVGNLVDYGGQLTGLSARLEATLPEVLDGYDSAAVGKWHLASPQEDGLVHPLLCGFHHYEGSMFNLGLAELEFDGARAKCSGRPGYFDWVKSVDPGDDGAPRLVDCTSYATSDTADDAIARARTLRPPWFLYVAFNAAHLPHEPPPERLCPLPADCFSPAEIASEGSPALADAIVETLDRELARLLAEVRRVDPEAYVFVIS